MRGPFSSHRQHAGSCHFCTYALQLFFFPSVVECDGGPHPIFSVWDTKDVVVGGCVLSFLTPLEFSCKFK